MKVSKRQLRQIIKEEKQKHLHEMNSDGSISEDEDGEQEVLLVNVENQLNELITHVITEADRIGGDDPTMNGRAGIKKKVFDLMADMIHSYKR